MSEEREAWDSTYRQLRADGVLPVDGSWLEAHLPLLRQHGVRRILEVGCGSGVDSKYLTHCGFDVTATDYSPEAIALAQAVAPGATFLQHDTRDRFPFEDAEFDLVLASLSLHYFDALQTRKIVGELGRLLRPEGLLLYRMNSASDPAASKGQRVHRVYYTEEDCRRLFEGWGELALTERTVAYFGRPKILWEGLVQKR